MTESLGEPPSGQAGPEQRIAIIGMAGRFPGAPDVAAFWELLREGREGLTRHADVDTVPGAGGPSAADAAFVPVAGSLCEPAAFDADFFGFAPAEADVTDPQHRLFLECSWQALEDSGHAPRGDARRVGVFAGASHTSYRADRITGRPGADRVWLPVQIAVGNDIDNIPLRVSYKFGLTGPSITVQTACSSALVAVHLACHSLLLRECDMALAGGACVRVLERSGYLYQEGGVLSPDGHCRPFDAAAAGTVAGDGVGVLVLKRLDDALRDRDHIRALILGTAVNNDGAAKLGFTAPSVSGQAAVIIDSFAAAGVNPDTIDFIEAHGTATPLGDPIEVHALAEAFGSGHGASGRAVPRLLGSVKSNIGHLDAAAGIAGLIKTVLALEHRFVPATLHYTSPNPDLDLEANGFRVNASGTPWPQTGRRPARAGVSSFGFGGTNAHVVLEAAPAAPRARADRTSGWQILPVSARTPASLAAARDQLSGHLAAHPELDLADVALTLQVGRAEFAYRHATVAGPQTAPVSAAGAAHRAADGAPAPARTDPPVVFLLPGQGSQYPGMGSELYQGQPVFRAAVDECAGLFAAHLGLDIRPVMFGHDGAAAARLAQTAHTQPAVFTLEVALARLLAHWGVRPAAMLGHSLGELAAACLAGVFTLDDAVAVVAARGMLIQQAKPGRMLAVPLSPAEVGERLGGLLTGDANTGAEIVAVNAPTTCVVAGNETSAARVLDRLSRQRVACRPLETSHAFHTALMDPVLPAFAQVLRGVRLQRPRVPFPSNTTGTWITDEQATDPGYWAAQVRRPVDFSAGMRTLLAGGDSAQGNERELAEPLLVEVGPGTALRGFARLHRGWAGPAAAVSLLRRSRTEPIAEECSLLEAVAALWERGVAFAWPALHDGQTPRRVPLPTYCFERREHLLPRPDSAPRTAAGVASAVAAAAAPLAGPALAGPPHVGIAPDAEPAPPGGEQAVAAEVAEVWREVLGLVAVGHDEDFYQLGGSSLYAIQIMGRLREIQPDLPMSAIFATPTVAGIVETIFALRAGAMGAGAPGDPSGSPAPADLATLFEGMDPAEVEALLGGIEDLSSADVEERLQEVEERLQEEEGTQ